MHLYSMNERIKILCPHVPVKNTTLIHIYILYSHIYAYIHNYTGICATYIHTYTHTYTCTCALYIQTYVHTHILQIYIHIYILIPVHMLYTYIYTYQTRIANYLNILLPQPSFTIFTCI